MFFVFNFCLFFSLWFWRESFSATSESAIPLDSTEPRTHQGRMSASALVSLVFFILERQPHQLSVTLFSGLIELKLTSAWSDPGLNTSLVKWPSLNIQLLLCSLLLQPLCLQYDYSCSLSNHCTGAFAWCIYFNAVDKSQPLERSVR